MAAVYGVGNTVADLFYSREGCFSVLLILTHYLGTEEVTQMGTILPFLCLSFPQMPPTPISLCSHHPSPFTESPSFSPIYIFFLLYPSLSSFPDAITNTEFLVLQALACSLQLETRGQPSAWKTTGHFTNTGLNPTLSKTAVKVSIV